MLAARHLFVCTIPAATLVLAAPAGGAAQAVPESPAPATASVQPAGAVRGRVVNAAGQGAIGLAAVEVTRAGARSGTPVTRVATAGDGTFRIPGLAPGRYAVRVRAIGYGPRVLPVVVVGAGARPVDLGTIALTAAPLSLATVAVTGQRQTVQLAPDRNTYTVRDLPTTRGGTALDVLRNVPGVDVDIENVVSLRGNPGVTVQINGRPTPLTAAQLGDYLAQLPADLVARVEVVSNPSAREDPTGVAGFLNLVLRRRADATRSGALTASAGTTGAVQLGGNLGLERGRLTAFGSVTGWRENRPRTDAVRRTSLLDSPATRLDQTGTRAQTQLGQTVTGNASLQLAPHDVLSLEGLLTTRVEDEDDAIRYRQLDAGGVTTGLSDRSNANHNHRYTGDATLGYRHAAGGDRHRLTAEARLFGAREFGPIAIVAQPRTVLGAAAGAAERERQITLEQPAERQLRVDDVRPLGGGLRLESGYKGAWQRFHDAFDLQRLDAATLAFRSDSAYTSDVRFDQTVHAGYAQLAGMRGRLQLQGGVRVEHAATRLLLYTTGATYDNAYGRVFPSALAAWTLDQARVAKLSYSTRIRRPDNPGDLNPTPQVLDPLNLSRGNPTLRPETIRAWELGLQQTGAHATVQLTPFWRHTTDAVRQVRTIDSLGVTTRSVANVATSDAYGTDLTLTARGAWASGVAGVSAFRQVSDAANLAGTFAQDLSARTFGWTARSNLTLRASRGLDVQTLVAYQSALAVEQGRLGSRARVSLAARQRLRDDRWSATVRVVDPFNRSRETTITDDPRFHQVADRRRLVRGMVLSVTRSFGRPAKERRDALDDGSERGA